MDTTSQTETCPECETSLIITYKQNGPADYDTEAVCPGCGYTEA